MSLINTETGRLKKYSEFVVRTPKLHPQDKFAKALKVLPLLSDQLKDPYMKRMFPTVEPITDEMAKEAENAEMELFSILTLGPKKLWQRKMLKSVGWRCYFTKGRKFS